jgi:biopolymer transport protein ExbD
MIIYLVKSTLLLALLWGMYKLLLENEKMHQFNRVFLLVALVAGLTAPLISIDLDPDSTIAGVNVQQIERVVNAPANAVSRTVDPVLRAETAPSQYEMTPTEKPPATSIFSVRTILLTLYALVTLILLVRFSLGLFQLWANIRSGVQVKISGATIILLDKPISPQSFLHFIFLNRSDYHAGKVGKEIIEHELTHVRQFHSVDVFLIELLKTILWVNPILYLYKRTIQLNHEFLADEAVISTGIALDEYQAALINTLCTDKILPVVSNFSFPALKFRVQMMSTTSKPIIYYVKLLILLPFILFLNLVVGCEPTSVNDSEDATILSEVRISINGNDQVVVNNVEMSLGELRKYLSNLPASLDLVKMTVDRNAGFGVITDVQRILKQYNASKIDYNTGESDELLEKIQ